MHNTISKENLIYYKLDNYYKPSFERGIIWNDKKLKMMATKKPKISKRYEDAEFDLLEIKNLFFK